MELYKRNPNTSCLVCGKAIYRRPAEITSGRVFCGSACYGIANRKEIPCVICNKPILSSLHRKTCSRKCSNVHRAGINYKIGSPGDKALQVRALKIRIIKDRGTSCERCGYNKTEILQIHHKDRNRENNRMDNLELICPNCHYEEHYIGKTELYQKGSDL